MEQEQPASEIEILFERVESFGKTTYELSKLKILETTIQVVTSLLSSISVVIMLLFFALVLNIGIALYLGELLGKIYYGFFIVAAFYLLIGIIFKLVLYKWIKNPVGNFLIKQTLR